MVGGSVVFLGLCIIIAAFIVVSVRAFQVNPSLVKKVFRYMVIAGIGLAFSIAAVAIGWRLSDRNDSSFSRSFKSVSEIWGGEVTQGLPSFSTESFSEEQFIDKKSEQYGIRKKKVLSPAGFASHTADIGIKSNIRQKGLLKFAGYNLSFKAHYECANTDTARNTFYFYFPLPDNAGNISDLRVTLNGKEYTGDRDLSDGIDWSGSLSPGERISFDIAYSAQGSGSFRYGRVNSYNSDDDQSQKKKSANGKVEINSFNVVCKTDFRDVTVLDGTMAPGENNSDANGSVLSWKASKLVLDQDLGVKFGISANYGALFAKIFFYAPLVIFLFLAFLLIFTSAKGISLHPMHYIFLTAGFFVFYLLGSYVVSYMHVVPAILISLSVSTAVTWYYARAIGKGKTFEKITLLCCAVFQWFFSAAFFFPEHTGLLITVASIGALVVLMKLTVKTDWENKW
jgi:hypothetical protein